MPRIKCESVANPPKPPYTSVSDVDAFFERIERIAEPKPPKKVDADWIRNYDFETAHPSAIPSMLRWLRIINDEGESTGVWDKLRVESSRQATLEQLVRDAYKGIFEAIQVESATRGDLRGAFVTAYSVGDSTRHINCFLALCRHAGLQTAVVAREPKEKPNAESRTTRAPKSRSTPTKTAKDDSKTTARSQTKKAPEWSGISVTLNVEIPAEWTEEQIRERVVAVRRAVESADTGDS